MPVVRKHDGDDETAIPLLATETDASPERDGDAQEQPHLRQTSQYSHTQAYESRRNDQFLPPKLRRRTPLPLLQLFILCATRLSEPISYTQIFPVRFTTRLLCFTHV